MSWNYRLDTPMMQLAEEVNKKYDTDSGNMLLALISLWYQVKRSRTSKLSLIG